MLDLRGFSSGVRRQGMGRCHAGSVPPVLHAGVRNRQSQAHDQADRGSAEICRSGDFGSMMRVDRMEFYGIVWHLWDLWDNPE